MKNIKLNLFEIGTIFWMMVGSFVLLFSLLGIFNFYSTFLGIFLSITIPIFMFKKKFFGIEKLSNSFKFLTLIVFIFGLFLSFFTTPTIFGGRDEGSYSNSAVMLAKNGQYTENSELIENFFDIYGVSKALNFPGFQYNSEEQLESQFLPGYPSWLAIFYQLFGLNGLKFVNLLPFMTFLLAFYLLIIEVFPLIKNPDNQKECFCSELLKKCCFKLNQAEQFAWLGTILLATFLPLIIFYKFTLSEIYFASLTWFSVYLLIRYLKNKNFFRFKLIFIPLFLTLFIRIEAIAIIFALLLIMIGKDFNHLRKAPYQFFFAFLGFVLILIIWLEPDFFINALKGISDISGLNANAIPESREKTLIGKLIPDDWKNFYAFKIWINYNLLPFFIMSGTFLLFFFKSVFKDMKFGNEKAQIIIPFLFFLPVSIYLIDANISLDHPWMLRRWVFAIIPIIVFYSILFLFYLKQKNKFLFSLITLFLFIGNFSLIFFPLKNNKNQWVNYLTFSQNEKLFQQVQDLSKLFGKNDLILISQKSSGSGWSLIAEPMRNVLGYQAVYFFNAQDYAKLDHDDFDNIFLITTEEEEFLYENILKEKIAERVIENDIIDPSREPLEKPYVLKTQTKINIYRIVEN